MNTNTRQSGVHFMYQNRKEENHVFFIFSGMDYF